MKRNYKNRFGIHFSTDTLKFCAHCACGPFSCECGGKGTEPKRRCYRDKAKSHCDDKRNLAKRQRKGENHKRKYKKQQQLAAEIYDGRQIFME
jgi:hypothetical protein